MGKILLWLIFFLITTTSLWGQLFGLPHLEKYTSANGLSNNSIMDLHQDSLGFLWIATADGLNRYDGYEFINYLKQEGGASSIADNWLHAITETEDGRLWIGTQKEGLCTYDYQEDRFTSLRIPPELEDSDQYLSLGKSILVENDHCIWLGMSPGIVKISMGKDTVFSVVKGGKIIVSCIYRSRTGDIWAGSSVGLFWKRKGCDEKFIPVEALPAATSGLIRAIREDWQGRLLIGAENGVFLLEKSPKTDSRSFGLRTISTTKSITSMVCDRKGRIWIGGKEGLQVLDGENFSSDPKAIQVLSNNQLDEQYINSLLIDREDNLWIGTANSGLLRLFLSDRHFPVFRPNNPEKRAGITENITAAFMDKDGTVWLGTYGGGLLRFDRETITFTNYKSGDQQPHPLTNNIIYSIYRDHRGTLWVGAWEGGGLNQVVENGGQLHFIHRPAIDDSGEGDTRNINSIQQIFEDEYQNLWVASNGGILKKSKDSANFRLMTGFSLPFNSINHILEDTAGNWWIGTWNGLFVFDRKKVALLKEDKINIPFHPDACFYADRAGNGALTNNRITYLHQDRKGRIWVGTYGGGLHRWEGAEAGFFSEKFKTYTQEDGLPNDVIYGILEDEKQRLWLSTNNGLVLFDPDQEVFRTYTEADGLQSNQHNLHAYNTTPSGEFIFGGVNGFNIFNPLQFSVNPESPPEVLITDFQIKGEKAPVGKRQDGTTVSDKAILTADALQLQPYDNSFSLHFAVPTFNDASKLKYAYRLVGFDEKWQEVSHQNRTAYFSNLFEGDYTFLVKASVDGQHWSPAKTLKISIAPPWYRTWWAFSLAGLLVFAAFLTVGRLSYVYSNLQNRLKIEQLSRQKEMETNEIRMWFFTYISHEFRTPLNLIISPLSEMINDLSLPVKVREKLRLTYINSKRLLRLVKQILNFRMVNSEQLNLRATEIDVVEFIKEIYLSFTSHAEDRKIKYNFQTDSSKIPLWFDEEKMELVIYNLLSNAFKYSNAGGRIDLKISRQDEDWVVISVKDNGIGIHEDNLHQIFDPFYRATNNQYTGSGIGLALVKNLVEIHHGQVQVESREGVGSEFRVLLKTGHAHFTKDQFYQPLHQDLTGLKESAFTNVEGAVASAGLIFPGLGAKEKPQILLVEDDIAILKYFRQNFEPEFRVYEARNGKEGLALAQEHVPDLIISDIMMPVMDGITLCRKLKSNIETSHIPIILLTARTALAHQMEGFESGAFEYITKPVNINMLKFRALAVLKNTLQLREHYKHESILPAKANQSTAEEKFLLKAAQCVEDHLKEQEFSAQDFSVKMGVSRSGLHRKLIALTGKSTTQFMRYVRLKHAERLLREGQTNISQTAYEVGFNDLKYFRKCFKEEFNMAPSEFVKEVRT